MWRGLKIMDERARTEGGELCDFSEWEPLSPDISEEELDHRARSNEKRYTTTEVLAHLENL